jgi:hypothetical protein
MDLSNNPLSLSALAEAADFAEPLSDFFWDETTTHQDGITTTTTSTSSTTTTTQLYRTAAPLSTMPLPFKTRSDPNLPPEFDFASDSLVFRADKSIDWHKISFEFPKAGDGTNFDGRQLSEYCTPVTYAKAFYGDTSFYADQPSKEVLEEIYKQGRHGKSRMDPREKKYHTRLFGSAEAKARKQLENDFGWSLSITTQRAKASGLGLQQQPKEFTTNIKWMCEHCKAKKKVGICAVGHIKFTKTSTEEVTTTTTTTDTGDGTTTNPTNPAEATTTNTTTKTSGIPTIEAEVTILMLFPHDKNCNSKPNQNPDHHPKALYSNPKFNHYLLQHLDHKLIFGSVFDEFIQNVTVGEEVFKQYPKLDGAVKINTGGWDDREFCPLPYYGKSKSIVSSITEEKFIPVFIRLSFWVMQQCGIANDACPFKVDHGPAVPVCGYEGYLDTDDSGAKPDDELNADAVAFAEKSLKTKGSPNSSVSSVGSKSKTNGKHDCVTRYIHQLRWYPNPRFHLYFSQNTVILGGMDMKGHTDPSKVIHQVLHNDSTKLKEFRVDPDHPLYQGKQDKLVENASFIAPIVPNQSRKIYHINPEPKNQFEILYGQALWFSGAWPHGGWTYLQSECFDSITSPDGSQVSRRLFRPAFHGHLDSIHLQRDADFLNIGYDVVDGYRPPEHAITGPTADILTAESAFQEQESALQGTVAALLASKNRDKLNKFTKFDQAKIIMLTQLTTPMENFMEREYDARGSQVAPHLPDDDLSFVESAMYLAYRALNAVAGSTAVLKKGEKKAVQNVMKAMQPLLSSSVQEFLATKKRSNKEKNEPQSKAKKSKKGG